MFICVWVFVFLRNFILLCIYIKEEGRARRMEVQEKGADGESDGNGPAGLAPASNSAIRGKACAASAFAHVSRVHFQRSDILRFDVLRFCRCAF